MSYNSFFIRSIKETESSNLVICLGTSLRIRPICNVPQRVFKRRVVGKTSQEDVDSIGRLAIVNLQRTHKDEKASLVIHAKCDTVMYNIVKALDLKLPVWYRKDGLTYSYKIEENYVDRKVSSSEYSRGSKDPSKLILTVYIAGRGGDKCGIPWLDSAELVFPKNSGIKGGQMKSYLTYQNCLRLERKIDIRLLPMRVTILMKVKDKWDQIAKICNGKETRETLPFQILNDNQKIGEDGQLLRNVQMIVTKEERFKEHFTEFTGDCYDVQAAYEN